MFLGFFNANIHMLYLFHISSMKCKYLYEILFSETEGKWEFSSDHIW